MDFFSGSATTAHATYKYMSENGDNIKYIMVQWPEPIDEKSDAYKAGYKTICDIGKERVRKAGQSVEGIDAVFRDSSMANDSVATNFEQIFATYSPETVRKVL